jgi:hypothetical protein
MSQFVSIIMEKIASTRFRLDVYRQNDFMAPVTQ